MQRRTDNYEKLENLKFIKLKTNSRDETMKLLDISNIRQIMGVLHI